MSLDIGDALHRGVDDLTDESGLLVVAVLVLYNLLNLVVGQSFSSEFVGYLSARGVYSTAQAEMLATVAGGFPLAVDVGFPAAVALALALVLVGECVRFWAIRTVAIPAETAVDAAGERLGQVLVLGGGVAVGLFLLGSVVPLAAQLAGPFAGIVGSLVSSVGSLVLLAAFVYLRQEIALNDGGYGATVRRSLARFMDAPGRILLLLVILGVVGLLAGAPQFLGPLLGLTGAGTVGQVGLSVLGTVLGAVAQALGIAAVTAAYLQVRRSAERQV